MDKSTQLQEMARIMHKTTYINSCWLPCQRCITINNCLCDSLKEAMALYNAGYRKKDELVKEIVAYLKQFEGYAQIAAEELEKKYNDPLV